jgi:proteasome-associated ATPase
MVDAPPNEGEEKKEEKKEEKDGSQLVPQPPSPEELMKQKEKEFEEAMAKLKKEMAEEKAKIKSDLHTKERELEGLESRYQSLLQMFEKVKEPPLIHAYIVRKLGEDLDESEVVVVRGNDMLKVTTGKIPKVTLEIGQYVWLHPQTYAIVGTSKQYHQGIIAKIFDVQENKLIITTEEGQEKRIVDFPKKFIHHLKPGFVVAVLPPTFEVLDILPNYEVKNLFLGEKPNIRYATIGGLDEEIERIKDVIVLPYQVPKLFASVNLKAPKGILLHGPPGCGKTLLAKAVATEHEMTFFNISVADILSKWVGESERIIKELFKQAKENRPAIIFFDEIEALFTTRGRLDTSGVHKNIIGQILAEMDGIVELEDVYVIGATNRPDLLDPALMRPGRFDEIIEINRPGKKGGMQILKVYLTDDLPVHKKLVDKHGTKKKAFEALRKYIIDELFGEEKWIEVKVDKEAKKPIKTVKRKDVMSGAIIAAIVKTAKKNYIKRIMNMDEKEREGDGLTIADFKEAIIEECQEHALTEYYVIQKRQRELLRRTGDGDPMVG